MTGKTASLDYVRLALAGIVVLFHAQVLAGFAPILPWLLSPTFAVQAFFVLSGAFIFRALDRDDDLLRYAARRFWRIYPAYAVVVVVSACLLVKESGLELLAYLIANLSFANFLAPSLPGVFGDNLETAINGSLWTLKIEVGLYILAPFLVALGRRFGVDKVLSLAAALSVVWLLGFVAMDQQRIALQLPGQLCFFCLGGILARRRWPTILTVSVPPLRADISFGLYLVHYPIIQSLVSSGLADRNLPAFVALSLGLSCAAAFLIWHLVEKPVAVWQARSRRKSTAVTAPA